MCLALIVAHEAAWLVNADPLPPGADLELLEHPLTGALNEA